MKPIYLKPATTVLFIALGISILSSCGNMNDNLLTRLQAGGLGGIAGGAAGAGAGAAIAGSNHRAEGAIIGGVIGLIAGAYLGDQWGQSIVKKKNEYASTEAYLNANIQQLDSRISEAQRANKKLTSQLNNLKKNNKKLSCNDYNNLRKQTKANIALINQDLDNARTAIRDAQGNDLKELKDKAGRLRKERDSMLASINELNRYSARA